jgi:transposase-like protein
MNPETEFCPNETCKSRGRVGTGNIRVHDRKRRRYRCRDCGKTFSARQGTAMWWLKKPVEMFTVVVDLIAHGCPIQAIVAAFGLDERTVNAWLKRAGVQSAAVHNHVVAGQPRDLGQVQADEIKAKVQGGSIWMALAMMVSTRLWLGGAVSPRRDSALIEDLIGQVRAIALCQPLLLAVDGLASYIKAFRQAFRSPLPTGRAGRPRLIPWPDMVIVQVVKHRGAAAFSIHRRIVQGGAALVEQLIRASQGAGTINTAYIERLNATFRQRLGCLARRSRHLARQASTLSHGMYLVGSVYNFCTTHDSLRVKLHLQDGWCASHRWVHRTPAMAAGLTDHCWSIAELLTFKVPPPPFVPPKRRGRPPKLRSGLTT